MNESINCWLYNPFRPHFCLHCPKRQYYSHRKDNNKISHRSYTWLICGCIIVHVHARAYYCTFLQEPNWSCCETRQLHFSGLSWTAIHDYKSWEYQEHTFVILYRIRLAEQWINTTMSLAGPVNARTILQTHSYTSMIYLLFMYDGLPSRIQKAYEKSINLESIVPWELRHYKDCVIL